MAKENLAALRKELAPQLEQLLTLRTLADMKDVVVKKLTGILPEDLKKSTDAIASAWILNNIFKAAQWDTLNDLSRFRTNPFFPLLMLYRLGALSVKFQYLIFGKTEIPRCPQETQTLIVHLPMKLTDGNIVSACLAFPESQDSSPEANKEVLFYHEIISISQGIPPCTRLKPLKPEAPYRVIY